MTPAAATGPPAAAVADSIDVAGRNLRNHPPPCRLDRMGERPNDRGRPPVAVGRTTKSSNTTGLR